MLIFGLFGCSDWGAEDLEVNAAGQSQPNVLLVVVDSLRADRLGCYGNSRATSPAIDSLARDAIRFEHAYATAPWTMPSVASILTGLYPSEHGVQHGFRKLALSHLTLPERLKARGYRTAAVVSHQLVGERFQFDQGFDAFSSDHARNHQYISTQGVTDQAIAQLEGLSTTSPREPFLLPPGLPDLPGWNWLCLGGLP